MADTKIDWADKVWNPVTGCNKVSSGCAHCYAEKMTRRLTLMGQEKYKNGFKVAIHPEDLEIPTHWNKPAKIFVNSMSDLFHDDVEEKFIAKVFGIMWLCWHLTFIVLTKRPARMAKLLNDEDFQFHTGWFASQAIHELGLKQPENLPSWPNPNIWLGVSVEDQPTADLRIPLLLQTPAAKRIVSVEPQLEEISIKKFLPFDWNTADYINYSGKKSTGLDWVINGSESGPGARPFDVNWARSLRDQCQAANVPYFLKQMPVYGKLVKMPELDGVVYREFPRL